MTDKVIAVLDEHFIRLMRNWARATAGNSEQYAMTTAYDGLIGGDSYDSRMPVIMGEVDDVDAAFPAVPQPDRQAVQFYWLFEGRSFRWLAGRLKCSDKTVINRCINGHWILKAELNRRKAMLGQIAKVFS